MDIKQIIMIALIALGAFYIFADHETQKKYLPEFLGKLTHKQHQILGAIIWVGVVYMYWSDQQASQAAAPVPFYARASVAPQTSSEVLQLNIPPRRSSIPRSPRSVSTISLPSYSTLPSSSLSSLPTTSSN
jgi:hypothetical protein